MNFQNQQFSEVNVELDFNSFVGCTFSKCKLIYRGLSPVTLKDNNLNDCTYKFDGPAAQAVAFLRDLYASGASQIVEHTLDYIRGNKAPPLPGGTVVH